MNTDLKIKNIIDFCKTNINFEENDSYVYMDLPLCVIESIYSLNSKYKPHTINVRNRYAEAYLNNKLYEKDSLTDFIKRVNEMGETEFAKNILKNKQKLSGRPKISICIDIANLLIKKHIEHSNDLISYCKNHNDLTEELMKIKGLGKAGVNYLLMLVGDTSRVKYDTHIKQFLIDVTGDNISPEECEMLFKEVVESLKNDYPELTVRKLDNLIWRYYSK